MYLCPCPDRKLYDLDGVFINDRHLSTDQVLVLTQLVDHPFEVFVAGKLNEDKQGDKNILTNAILGSHTSLFD